MGLSSLFKSRKFWIMIVDVLISMLMFFGAKYIPLAMEDIKFVVLTLQPVVLLVIGAIASEDVAALKAGVTK